MSQFMLCKSEHNLERLNCVKFLSYKRKSKFLIEVANEYVSIEEQKNLWILPEMDEYCTKAQKSMNEGNSFENTELYYLLDKLYDECTDFILWYASDYLQLDEISNREEFFDLIEQEIRCPYCELYIIMKKS